MHPIQINDSEMARLKIARQTHKWGHLASWKELYIYQRTLADKEQNIEIGKWAKKKLKGEPITLPLKDYINQLKESGLPETEIKPDLYETAKQIFS